MKPANEEELNRQADELAELIDSLVAGGSGRIHLEVGDETRVRTVNSTDCSGTLGACAVPTFFDEEDEDEF
jgi:hypothetical protein